MVGITTAAGSLYGHLTTEEKVRLVIDLNNLEVTTERRAALVREVTEAGSHGFFQIKNYGMSNEILEKIRSVGHKYFSQTHEEKTAHEQTRKFGTSKGYIWKKFESDDPDVLKSYREMFRTRAFPTTKLEENVWPASMPELQETIVEYAKGLRKTGLFLLGLFSEGLGLPADYIEKAIGELHMLCVLCNYPPQPIAPGKRPIHALDPHTDYNVVTFLQQDNTEGVQFWLDHQWNTLPILENENVMIVDIGELMEVLSNGKFYAGVHKVISSTRARLSIASPFEIAMEHTLFPAPELINENHPQLYKAIQYSSRLQGYMECLTKGDKSATTKNAIFLEQKTLDTTKNLYLQDGKIFIDGHQVEPYIREE